MPAESSPRILLASGNRHKRAEFERVLTGFTLVTPDTLGIPPEVVEDADDYVGNATLKAHGYAAWAASRGVELPALADDSGLEVDALGGRPGLHSARYAGPGATYQDNVDRLLGELRDVAPPDRGSRFLCAIVICWKGERVFATTGVCPGAIATEPRGGAGFGYDPVFVPEGSKRTFAELTSEEKDTISHRGRALSQLAAAVTNGSLRSLLTDRGAPTDRRPEAPR